MRVSLLYVHLPEDKIWTQQAVKRVDAQLRPSQQIRHIPSDVMHIFTDTLMTETMTLCVFINFLWMHFNADYSIRVITHTSDMLSSDV